MQRGRWWVAVLSLVAVSAWAQAPEQAEDSEAVEEAPALPELHPRTGEVVLGGGLAKLVVPESFGYLSPEDAEKVLVEVWGNPPGSKTLGMLIPSDVSVDSPESWGVVIQYDDDGHVEDEDAAGIDYADLLEEMQNNTREENAERVKAGYEAVALVGWAATPRYDASTRKLYWARELGFGDSKEHTLNYSVRVLGKEGVLVLNAVSSMVAPPQVEKDMQQVLGFTHFQPGHRYEDFDPKTGRVAAYGVAGLVAGKVAAKAGLFKGLLAVLVAGKKVVFAGLAFLVVALGKLFKRGGNDGTP
ncbi:DUF2167 domain-containing protein [Myxococcus qinghaiensis]|uniref:DUF2167 domain-containing protein n=1 Tax=Myxococcus qinghaiensis TaxID=2906758 RepID=UPI0020A7EFB5|nr:DUF2167 domain-containing protein [Myxococcus qinghaiensis]MCP3164899.1 DUF2167 domain-containing protein [Myxococcus qinghaiensis]